MTQTLQEVQAKSATTLSGLMPIVREAAEKLIERCYNRGVCIRITQGLRTYQQQDELFAQGRTKPGAVVTNARGGHSNHNFGVAIDFVLLVGGYDTHADKDCDNQADWMEVVEEAKKVGFAWGGDWKNFTDLPHFEMTFGISTAGYRAGWRPTQAQIDGARAKINAGDEEPMTAAEKVAFDDLSRNFVEYVSVSNKTISDLTNKIEVLVNRDSMACPTWAQEAVAAAKAASLIDTADGGSYDFYRLITVMHRKGLI